MTKTSSNIHIPQRMHISIKGAVQGVGFRPFVYHLGRDLGLTGYVCNSSSGVTIEAQGDGDQLENFLVRIKDECPAHACIQDMQYSYIPPCADNHFEIYESQLTRVPQAVILPDFSTCPQCLTDIFDPFNRRYQYPFTNCTHCGPRYSIVEKLPYDRANTSMKKFVMCSDCEREYHDPEDRRFHAQPNACPSCGPVLQLWDRDGKILARENEALTRCVDHLRDGKIVAIKGLGGFQLIVDACQPAAVRLLRERKFRQEKPLAMMFANLAQVKEYCFVSDAEESAFLSAQAPIVLLKKKPASMRQRQIAQEVSFYNLRWGIMRPYTPLHHLLMAEFHSPVVATSANFSQEPMCIDNEDALRKLREIADVFLVHDRPIVRPIDDSVGMVIKDRFSLIRRARGFAPLPIMVEDDESRILALGGHMKNTVAMKVRDKIYVSQHIADLDSPEAAEAFTQAIDSLRGLYPAATDCLAVDLHPDYFSTRFGAGAPEPKISVQHHHAHIVACMAEHQLKGPVLGLAWDGTGLGEDQTIWGGEFLLTTNVEFRRVGYLWPFRIPGGESSIEQPKRMALALLAEIGSGDIQQFQDLIPMKLFLDYEIKTIQHMINNGIRSPYTTSMGRLFDGISSLLGLCQTVSFEGQAAMALEHVIGEEWVDESYPWEIIQDSTEGPHVLDWRIMLKKMIDDIRKGELSSIISAKFHNTLVDMAVGVAQRVKNSQVVLSGGCFQNKYLAEKLIDRLRQEGFEPYWPSQVPANDGGISLGQAVIAAARWKNQGGTSCA